MAGQVGIPAAQSGAALDSIQTALEIDRRLSELETQARANGSAVGSAFLYPVTRGAHRRLGEGPAKREALFWCRFRP